MDDWETTFSEYTYDSYDSDYSVDYNWHNLVCMTNKNRSKKPSSKYNNKYAYLHASRGIGKQIVNAITGIRTEHRIGSLDENLYFSVSDSRSMNGEKDPNIFYFDSPEQFETFMFNSAKSNVSVSYVDKTAWNNKRVKSNKINKFESNGTITVK